MEILTCVVVILGALLAIDNALDIVAKAFGNKKWDTILGQIAVKLNAALTIAKTVTPPVAPTTPPTT